MLIAINGHSIDLTVNAKSAVVPSVLVQSSIIGNRIKIDGDLCWVKSMQLKHIEIDRSFQEGFKPKDPIFCRSSEFFFQQVNSVSA